MGVPLSHKFDKSALDSALWRGETSMAALQAHNLMHGIGESSVILLPRRPKIQ
jgi:hypothetical protein